MGREGTNSQGRLLCGNDICDVNAKQLQEYLREECSKQMGDGHELCSFRRQTDDHGGSGIVGQGVEGV